jgi:hypothetical protein
MFAALFGRPTRYGKGSGDVSFWAEYPLSSQAAAASEANLNALLTRPNSARLLEEFPTEWAIHSMDPPPALKATGAVMEFTADNMDSRMLAEAVTVLLEDFSGCAEILIRTAEMVMVTFTNLDVASHFVECFYTSERTRLLLFGFEGKLTGSFAPKIPPVLSLYSTPITPGIRAHARFWLPSRRCYQDARTWPEFRPTSHWKEFVPFLVFPPDVPFPVLGEGFATILTPHTSVVEIAGDLVRPGWWAQIVPEHVSRGVVVQGNQIDGLGPYIALYISPCPKRDTPDPSSDLWANVANAAKLWIRSALERLTNSPGTPHLARLGGYPHPWDLLGLAQYPPALAVRLVNAVAAAGAGRNLFLSTGRRSEQCLPLSMKTSVAGVVLVDCQRDGLLFETWQDGEMPTLPPLVWSTVVLHAVGSSVSEHPSSLRLTDCGNALRILAVCALQPVGYRVDSMDTGDHWLVYAPETPEEDINDIATCFGTVPNRCVMELNQLLGPIPTAYALRMDNDTVRKAITLLLTEVKAFLSARESKSAAGGSLSPTDNARPHWLRGSLGPGARTRRGPVTPGPQVPLPPRQPRERPRLPLGKEDVPPAGPYNPVGAARLAEMLADAVVPIRGLDGKLIPRALPPRDLARIDPDARDSDEEFASSGVPPRFTNSAGESSVEDEDLTRIIDSLVRPTLTPPISPPLPAAGQGKGSGSERRVGLRPDLEDCSRKLDFSPALRIVFSNKEFLTTISTMGWGVAMGIYLCGVRPAVQGEAKDVSSLCEAVLTSLGSRRQPGQWSLPQSSTFSLTRAMPRPPFILPRPGEVVEVPGTSVPWQTVRVRGTWVHVRNRWGEERRVNGRPGLLVSSTSVLLTWIPAQIRERGNRASATAEGRSR